MPGHRGGFGPCRSRYSSPHRRTGFVKLLLGLIEPELEVLLLLRTGEII